MVKCGMILCKKCHNPVNTKDSSYICSSCNFQYITKDGITTFSDIGGTVNNYFSKDTFEKVFRYESTSFWYRVRNQIICQTIKKYLSQPAEIIEVGCGTGYVATAIRGLGYTVDCADPYFDALSFCKIRNAGRSFFQLNLEDAVFFEEYGGVGAFDVLEHIENDNTALKNMYHLLKDGGYAFITVPACKSLWSAGDVIAEHKRRYTYSELEERVTHAGFQVSRITYFMTFLFPAYFIISKCSGNWSGSDSTSPAAKERWFSQFNPNPILNTVLYFIFGIEPIFLRYLNFPLGSSLLCVARKNVSLSDKEKTIK